MALSTQVVAAFEKALRNGYAAAELAAAIDLATSTNAANATALAVGYTGFAQTVDITVGAEDANVREIAVAFKNQAGAAVSALVSTVVYVFADAAGAALATTGGSTGIALGTAGHGILAATITAKKIFLCVTEPNGTLSLKWTDTGTEACFLGVTLPNGKIAISSALANAG